MKERVTLWIILLLLINFEHCADDRYPHSLLKGNGFKFGLGQKRMQKSKQRAKKLL